MAGNDKDGSKGDKEAVKDEKDNDAGKSDKEEDEDKTEPSSKKAKQ